MKRVFFKNIELQVLDGVYEPSDDSILLANSIQKENCKEKIVLDLGCGTGIQGINALFLGAKKVFFVDIDNQAISNAKANIKMIGLEKQASYKKSDLFSAIAGKKFDLIVFNPPYVDSGTEKKWLDTDGGKKGREILDSFLKRAKKHLLKGAMLFFVQSSLNSEAKTKRLLKEKGFKFEIVARKKLFFEELQVFKAWIK
jgi:release factor glutamine methyltransferase